MERERERELYESLCGVEYCWPFYWLALGGGGGGGGGLMSE